MICLIVRIGTKNFLMKQGSRVDHYLVVMLLLKCSFSFAAIYHFKHTAGCTQYAEKILNKIANPFIKTHTE